MGNRPSSYFGYGVALEEDADIGSDETHGSPWHIWSENEPVDGIAIISSGYYDQPSRLVLINESVSVSDDWMPKAIAPTKMQARPEWADKINAYLDRWNLRDKVAKGFESPGFIHAPYYG